MSGPYNLAAGEENPADKRMCLQMHHMVAPKYIMTNGQNIMECAGEQEKSDHADERKNNDLIVFFHYCEYCGHFKPPLI